MKANIFSVAALAFFVDHVLARVVQVDYSHQKLESRIVIGTKYCSQAQVDIITESLIACEKLAKQAAEAAELALNDQPKNRRNKLEEYFKSKTDDTAEEVKGVFNRIAKESGEKTEHRSISSIECAPPDYPMCKDPGSAASASLKFRRIALCPLFFDKLPTLTTVCHGSDRATTLIHEFTHLTQIMRTEDYFQKGELKVGGYGYEVIRGLSQEQNIMHADTYGFFANAVYVSQFGTCDG